MSFCIFDSHVPCPTVRILSAGTEGVAYRGAETVGSVPPYRIVTCTSRRHVNSLLYRLLRQAALLNAVLNTQDRRTLLNRVFSEWDATEHPWIQCR
jgi:hypothetical protein